MTRTSQEVNYNLPRWIKPFLFPAMYKSARGGRGSGKSWAFAQLAIMRMAGHNPNYPKGPVRIASARQFQNSVDESVKQLIENLIKSLGLSDEFIVKKYWIDHKNGSHIYFPGFNRSPQSFMSVEDLDILWIEQAESLQDEMEIIEPSVRKEGSEIMYSWNPSSRAQYCWRRFVLNPQPDDVSVHVNWYQNPWWTSVLERRRQILLQTDPELYNWMYLGEPNDADAESVVLPYVVLKQCVEAFEKGLAPKPGDIPLTDAGFDIAEGGTDKCSLAIRQGPTVTHLDVWPGVTGDLSQAAHRAHEPCQEVDTYRLYYDASAPIRTDLLRLEPTYAIRPINFGGAVGGPDVNYEHRRANKDVFARRNIQMAMNLRLRANRTARLLRGEDVLPEQCLFIDPDMFAPNSLMKNIEAYLAELSGPIRRLNPTTGKWELDKRGGEQNEKSPDSFDSTCLAFARDSDAGLRAR